MNNNAPAIEHTNRREVWQALSEIKDWTKRIEWELQQNKDGVIPYLQLESLSKATFQLVYASGHVNAMILAGVKPTQGMK